MKGSIVEDDTGSSVVSGVDSGMGVGVFVGGGLGVGVLEREKRANRMIVSSLL